MKKGESEERKQTREKSINKANSNPRNRLDKQRKTKVKSKVNGKAQCWNGENKPRKTQIDLNFFSTLRYSHLMFWFFKFEHDFFNCCCSSKIKHQLELLISECRSVYAFFFSPHFGAFFVCCYWCASSLLPHPPHRLTYTYILRDAIGSSSFWNFTLGCYVYVTKHDAI